MSERITDDEIKRLREKSLDQCCDDEVASSVPALLDEIERLRATLREIRIAADFHIARGLAATALKEIRNAD